MPCSSRDYPVPSHAWWGSPDYRHSRTSMGALEEVQGQLPVPWLLSDFICPLGSQQVYMAEPHVHAVQQVPFSIFTATVVYPALPFSLKAVASTTFPNSPSPRVFPRTKFFRGNSHFGSSYIGVDGRETRERGRNMV